MKNTAIKFRIVRNDCNCHPETCCHFRYLVEIFVDEWVKTNLKSDHENQLRKRINESHPSWEEES